MKEFRLNKERFSVSLADGNGAVNGIIIRTAEVPASVGIYAATVDDADFDMTFVEDNGNAARMHYKGALTDAVSIASLSLLDRNQRQTDSGTELSSFYDALSEVKDGHTSAGD